MTTTEALNIIDTYQKGDSYPVADNKEKKMLKEALTRAFETNAPSYFHRIIIRKAE